MYVRNYKGKMVEFNWRDYASEKEMYRALWKICYNIELKDEIDQNKELIDFIS
tara:strand:- start:115 stop:273 length:159 start_codon:yes stop_codon:yes gene_type:complete